MQNNDHQQLYQETMQELNHGRRVVMLSSLLRGAAPAVEKTLLKEADMRNAQASAGRGLSLARAALEEGELKYETDEQGNALLAEPYFPLPRLIILGGGHIAKPLAEFSAKSGFSVTVVDDRPVFANAQRFPWAERVLCESFSRCFPLLEINRSSFIVIITRGHRHDMACVRQALGHEAAYIGMIGSRRRIRAAMAQLLLEDFPKEKVEAIHAPIGLDIGAQTPAEISISILAQLIQVKRSFGAHNWPEPDMDVLLELSRAGEDARAAATIVGARGSIPRETGAKMVIWPYGKTLGSIGGGCGESEVIKAAREVIRSGESRIMEIDMTGQVAEDEGMVCGGIMQVLIERY